ncbi:YdgA family protein [[Pasteurella] aerogenes]|nr:YdgA family protein [[Pasteurella] aerogenes]UWZ92297.1 YdgA family protein [[Pasteurella] aerogenes]
MKKSTLAIGVLVALGALWSGGAWYTGKIAEENYVSYLQQINRSATLISTEHVLGKVENVKFERGFFSSTLSYDLLLTSAKDNITYRLPMAGKVYHGPITLNNFSVAMFSADLALQKNEQTALWFTDDKSNPLALTLAMGYNQQVKGELDSSAKVNIIDAEQLQWTGNVQFDVDKKGFGKTVGNFPSLTINKETEDPARPNTILLKNVKVNVERPSADLFNGQYQVSIADFALNGIDKKGQDYRLQLDDVSLSLNLKQEQNWVNSDFVYQMADVKENNRSVVGLQWNMKLNHLDADALRLFLQEADKLNQQKNLSAEGINALEKLLNNQPHLQLSPLELTNSKGKATLNLDVDVVQNVLNTGQQGKILDLFNALKGDLNLDKAFLKELIATSLMASDNRINQADAEQNAQNILDKNLKSLVNQGLFKETEDKYTLTFNRDNGKLNVSGKDYSEQDIQAWIFVLAMMIYAGGL